MGDYLTLEDFTRVLLAHVTESRPDSLLVTRARDIKWDPYTTPSYGNPIDKGLEKSYDKWTCAGNELS